MLTHDRLTQFLNDFDENKHDKFIEIYIISFNKHVEVCLNALKNKDAKSLEASVHDVKSLAYTIGDQELGDLADCIESALKTEDYKYAFEHTDTLTDNLYSLIHFLKAAK